MNIIKTRCSYKEMQIEGLTTEGIVVFGTISFEPRLS
jgi:hypothetical protein